MEYKSISQSETIHIGKDILTCLICFEIAFDGLVYECCCTIICNDCYDLFQKN